MIKLSIVIPCYNEEKNVPIILTKFSEIINRPDVEVILVNNGSTDSTQKCLEELLPRYTFAKTILIPVNQGYGYGILQGLKISAGDYIGWTHADLQTDPADVIKALDIIEKAGNPEHIFVKGNRKGRPFFDQFFTVGMGIFESLYLHGRLYDINAQPNIFSKAFFETWKEPPYDFALDLYALHMAMKQGVPVHRFPVRFPERLHGHSSWNTGFSAKWNFIKRTIQFSKNLKAGGIK